MPGLRAAPKEYTRQATWQETVRVSLEKLADASPEDQRKTTRGPGGTQLGPWHLVGPFRADSKKRFKTAFPPLESWDTDKPCGGKKWEIRRDLNDGTVHTLKSSGNAATFLQRTITSPKKQPLKCYFGSDDGMALWLNGKKTFEHDVPRGPAPNQEKVKVPLIKGPNRLLFMIYNNGGGHGFYFSTSKTPGSKSRQTINAVWNQIRSDFPAETDARQIRWELKDRIWSKPWKSGDFRQLAQRYASRAGSGEIADTALKLAKSCSTPKSLQAVREAYYLNKWAGEAEGFRQQLNEDALVRAVRSIAHRFPEAAGANTDRLARIEAMVKEADTIVREARTKDAKALAAIEPFLFRWTALRKDALLANPALDFKRVLFVKRKGTEGLTQNWQGNDRLHNRKIDNEIAAFPLRSSHADDVTLFKPKERTFVGDVDLHFDATRMLFSTNGTVCEANIDGSGFRKVITEIDSYDPCYLPDGRVLFISNSGHHAVPCVGGNDYVGNLHIANADGTAIRRLCFDQDNNWNPTVLANGRVFYTRWEYTDSAHYFSRVLMHMNPDGTNQVEFYGSNSYWPNSLFFARPIPESSTKFIAIVSGHHGPAKMGEMVLFDAALGRHEADGAIQKIPGFGKPVNPVIKDNLVGNTWPKFLHPYPVDEETFLVACRPSASSSWGIYLADIHDNLVPLKVVPGHHCLEPFPLRPQKRPPVIADRVRPGHPEATVYIQDIHIGRGLRGVPKGTVKNLRVFQYEYAYRHSGGHYVIGYEGPWDVRRLLGTVPVFEDGSAVFNIPANVPLAVQPLDAEGKALAQMRSWFVGMPGEFVSCVGCHEKQTEVPPARNTLASRSAPKPIASWHGPKRGFSFQREVQPVLDRHCVGCHSGKNAKIPSFVDDGEMVGFPPAQNRYSKPYLALHPYVRRNGPEGDYHTLTPLEFHADTSELVQLLSKGHHGVKLTTEAWDRLITWIDLNVPYYGTWKEAVSRIKNEYVSARRDNRRKYAAVDEDIEEVITPYTKAVAFEPPPRARAPAAPAPTVTGWPFNREKAVAMQATTSTLEIDLGDGLHLSLALVPAGTFVMGDANGRPDERPAAPVTVPQAFWLARFETTNQQYAQFDSEHDSGVYDMRYKDQVDRGYYVNQPDKPVIRVSWTRAMAFCEWLSKKTGRAFSLPTESQWEWACRAGADTPLSFGGVATPFGEHANLADSTTSKLAVRGVNPKPIPKPHPMAAFLPAIFNVNDKVLHLAPPGTYKPNVWGLHDMHGNVAEWTRSLYKPYPYVGDDRNAPGNPMEKRVVRGGSWRDRPHRARSAFRLAFPAWQQVYNVGFRVVCPVTDSDGKLRAAR